MEKKSKKYYTPKRLLDNKSTIIHKSDYVVFFIFFIISAFFWLLINLSKEYSLSYNMDVVLHSPPKDKIITGQVDSTVTFHINAQGFFLVKLEFMKPEELSINISNYTIHKADDNLYYVSTQPLKETIAKLLDINPSKIGFSKNTLSFYLEKLNKKKVNVVPKLSLNFAEFYNLYKPITVKPEMVDIFGPKEILDTLKQVYTVPISLNNVKESMEVTMKVDISRNSLLHVKPENIKVIVDVEKFTQSSVIIPVSNPDNKINIQTFPSKVTVYYNVALKDYAKVNSSAFIVVPDLTDVDLFKAEKLYLKVIRKPDFVRNVRVDPVQVEFIIVR